MGIGAARQPGAPVARLKAGDRPGYAIMALKSEVIKLYKQLIYLGRQYPKDPDVMVARIHNAFMKHRDETDGEKIKEHIAKGNYIIKELEALYMLRKYRTLKRRYYDTQEP